MTLVSYQITWFLNLKHFYKMRKEKIKYQLLFLEILFHKYILKLKNYLSIK